MERISLNGSDWQYKDFLGEDWIWRNAEKPDTRDVRWWRTGTVPGTVLHDLWQNDEVPDPYYERNSLAVEWVPARTWLYRKTFILDADLRGKRIQLHFKGVDYEAQFYLNGAPIGQHRGMYTPAVFEISHLLNYGDRSNQITVVIEKAPDEQPQVSKTSYVRTHKSRMTYWWDFCPRMIHQGIWDDVYLDITGPVRIQDIYIRPELADNLRSAKLSIATELSSVKQTRVRIETKIVFEGMQIASTVSEEEISAQEILNVNSIIELSDPQLWQPNGDGVAHLYEAHVTVTEVRGNHAEAVEEISASRGVTFGVRKVEWQFNTTLDQTALPYVLTVNGHKTYIRGWNWVPIDVMYGVERTAKLTRLLQLAKRAGVNMLRVWGGGLIEKDSFYDLCNQYGIMVWQEFIQSSSGIANKPSAEPEFIAMMVREAELILPRKRNHPSVVIWCGGNELQDSNDVPLDDNEPVLGALKQAVKRLHPDALWLPTSPTGRCFSNSRNNLDADPNGLHDVHGPWEHQGLIQHYELYNKGTSLLHSEFGVEGMTHLKTLNQTISVSKQWPATRDNPVYFHRGSWWVNEPMVQEAFGGQIDQVADLIKASQFLQADGLRYAIESNRRRKFQNSGSLPWQFNEPYPNAYCTSAIDYYTQPKPVYYAVAKAYLPVHVTARFAAQVWEGYADFEADIWVTNSRPQCHSDLQAAWSLAGASGRLYSEASWQGNMTPNSSMKLGSMQFPVAQLQEDLFFLSIRLFDSDKAIAVDNRYMFSRTANLVPMLSLPETQIQYFKKQTEHSDQWQVKLTNIGIHAAIQIHLADSRQVDAEGYVYLSDNDISLLPGETINIIAEWSNIPESDRKLELSAWNYGLKLIQ